MNSFDLVERIGFNILEREHRVATDYIEDDSEYIPRIKRLVDSISETLAENGYEKQECLRLQQNLYDCAKKLYLDSWMTHAEEDEGIGNFNPKIEQKRAYQTFDKYYK